MGIDAIIYFELTADEWPVIEGGVVREAGEYSKERAKGCTHELDVPWRFYGHYHERGPWPQICAALLELMADPTIKTVWYGGDCYDEFSPLTIDDLNKLSAHYVRNGNRPYYDKAPRVYADAEGGE